ncbi:MULTISPECIES: phosphate-starvation-inducible protein PsiE [Bacillaceae]|jgi:protein PsiE|uniref:phosphate-starvation-inducible protein PsiE n=1 Tax=Bacillaceae TaxID=186817 RepID=UPI00101D516D|nr:phosphate-starvation-inducible protein PsiE [Ectobacillus funiculus]
MKEQGKVTGSRLKISFILQSILNVALIILAIALCFMLGKEIIHFIRFSFFGEGVNTQYELLESILVFFLYFEFIAMIVKYFQEHYHFPIRYFLYIGITALIRLIIVHYENPMHTLLYTLAILVLVISYFIMNSATARRERL